MKTDFSLKNNIAISTLVCVYLGVLISIFDVALILVYKSGIFAFPWTPFVYPFFWVGFHLVGGILFGILFGLLIFPVFRIPFLSSKNVSPVLPLMLCSLSLLFLYWKDWLKLFIKERYQAYSWLIFEGFFKYITSLVIILAITVVLIPLWIFLHSSRDRCFSIFKILLKAGVVFVLVYVISYFSFIRSNTFAMPGFWSSKDSPFRKVNSQEVPTKNINYYSTKQATNVLLIVIDTLRADHMSLYGYKRETTPFLEKYAKNGAVFNRVYTQKTSTSPSVASILTGTYPHTHGIVGIREYLPDSAVTIGEILKPYGFNTASFVSNPNLSAFFNFNQGFDTIDDFATKDNYAVTEKAKGNLADAKIVNNKVFPWLKKHSNDKFFLYVHYIDPHAPYIPPPPYNKIFIDDKCYGEFKNFSDKDFTMEKSPTDIKYYNPDYFIAQYDGEILYVDTEIEKLIQYLDSLGLADNTLVVITADHGESLGDEQEYFFGHGYFGYESTAHIPLIMVAKDIIPGKKVIKQVVETIDIAPTILSFLNIPVYKAMEGMNLIPNVVGTEEIKYPRAYLEADSTRDYLTNIIVDGDYKLICNLDWPQDFDFLNPILCFDFSHRFHIWKKLWRYDPRFRLRQRWELYDLVNDPGEKINLAMSQPQVFQKLKAKLSAWMRRRPGFQNYKRKLSTLPSKTLKDLKTLGYIQ